MSGNPRLIAAILFVPFVAAMFRTQALAVPTMPVEHAAGCHSPMPAIPTPTPAGYQCCVMGHHGVMPGTAYSAGQPAAGMQSRNAAEFPFAVSLVSRHETSVVFSSASPPQGVPLRI